ncbi:hypothetical protein FACS1894163_02740 [Spirochaetia bacterium]|nr:hypothetical protein FACS1894163_02740 [Spirochaetia bacterium]
MKKSITVLFLLLLAVSGAAIILSCGSAPKYSHRGFEADFKVKTEDGKVTITGYTGKDAAMVIPATIGGLPVTGIEHWAFYRRTGLTSTGYTGKDAAMVIPATIGGLPVTGIEHWAFYRRTGLTSITIPAGVTSIARWAFENCTGLMAIQVDADNTAFSSRNGVLFNKAEDTLIKYPPGLKGQYAIPEGVTSIVRWAFENCTGLTSVSIPEGVTSIGFSAFGDCTGLMAIQVDADNTAFSSRNGVLFNKAEDTLIQYPPGLKGQYAIPEGVTGIGSGAFEDCTGLTSVSIPEGVTGIGSGAFEDCTGLTSVSIPEGVTSIAGWAFRNCTGLTSVSIPEGVTSIALWAFRNCTGLTSVSIPAGVTRIGSGAFEGCTSLSSVSIPASVILIYDDAFKGCTSLTAIQVDANNTDYSSRNGMLFNKTGDYLIAYPAGGAGAALPAAGPVTAQNAETARANIDKNYWRAQAQQRLLPAWNTFSTELSGSHDSDGNQVILDIRPGTTIYNVQDVYVEYAVSFRSTDMPEDVRRQLQSYRTAEGISYYEYVVSHVDRIILSPKFHSSLIGGSASPSNTIYPAERVITIYESGFDVKTAKGFVDFLKVLIHEAGHHHLFDLTKANIVTRKHTKAHGIRGTAEDERFADLQEFAFLRNVQYPPMNLDSIEKDVNIRAILNNRIDSCLTEIEKHNKTFGLPENNLELLPPGVYVPVAARPVSP